MIPNKKGNVMIVYKAANKNQPVCMSDSRAKDMQMLRYIFEYIFIYLAGD